MKTLNTRQKIVVGLGRQAFFLQTPVPSKMPTSGGPAFLHASLLPFGAEALQDPALTGKALRPWENRRGTSKVDAGKGLPLSHESFSMATHLSIRLFDFDHRFACTSTCLFVHLSFCLLACVACLCVCVCVCVCSSVLRAC